MKTLVLGDIHGNLIALERVMELYQHEVDAIICHGDVVNYGPWSNECVALLKNLNVICLKGNHEEAYIEGVYRGKNQLVKDFFEQTYPTFKYLDIIENYAASFEFENFVVQHTINDKYYYPDSDFSDINLSTNTIIGHSHYPFHKLLNNGRTLTNTGSVGQNRENLAIINFALINNSDVSIESIQYDPIPLIKEMKSRNYPTQCLEYYQKKIKQ